MTQNYDKCLNCEHEIVLNFCPNCGQKKYKRIDKKYLKDEIQYTVLHTNKGFFYTIKKLLLSPGKTTRNFIDGNRVNHYKPILLVFVLTGLSMFVVNKIIDIEQIYFNYYKARSIQPLFDTTKLQAFSASYTPILMVLFIPIQSIFTWLAFSKWGHNYYEHIVMNAFFQALITILNIVLAYPILFLLKDYPSIFMLAQSFLSFVIMTIAAFWFFRGFYHNRSFEDVLLRLLLLFGIAITAIIIISIVGAIVGMFLYREEMQLFIPARQ